MHHATRTAAAALALALVLGPQTRAEEPARDLYATLLRAKTLAETTPCCRSS